MQDLRRNTFILQYADNQWQKKYLMSQLSLNLHSIWGIYTKKVNLLREIFPNQEAP